MKTRLLLLLIGIALASASNARNELLDFSTEDGIDSYSQGFDIPFYFGEIQPQAKIVQKFGEFGTNKKTNAFGKADQVACHHAFNSALLSLQNRAISEGGNAVINIKSNYKGKITISDDTYRCGAGSIMVGVALKGTVVKLAE